MYRAFDTTGLGPLARLLEIYREDFRSATNTFTYTTAEGEEKTRPSAEAFERLAGRLEAILGTPKLREIEAALTRNLGALLGPDAQGAEISVRLPSSEDLLANALRLQVQDESTSQGPGQSTRRRLPECAAARNPAHLRGARQR